MAEQHYCILLFSADLTWRYQPQWYILPPTFFAELCDTFKTYFMLDAGQNELLQFALHALASPEIKEAVAAVGAVTNTPNPYAHIT
jgi:hypothetical protein